MEFPKTDGEYDEEEEEVDIKFHPVKVEEEANDDGDDAEYILGLNPDYEEDEDVDITETNEGQNRDALDTTQTTYCAPPRKPRFSCGVCGKGFFMRSQKAKHFCPASKRRKTRREHLDFIQDTFLKGLETNPPKEPSSSISRTAQQLQKAPQECLVCGKTLCNVLSGMSHLRRSHKDEVKIAHVSRLSRMTCDECGLLCYNERALKAHKTCKHKNLSKEDNNMELNKS